MKHPLLHAPQLALPPPWPTTNLCSVSMDLSLPNVPYKWNHTLCGFLCLAFFAEHNGFNVHPGAGGVSVLVLPLCS